MKGIWIWENSAPKKDEYADFTAKFVTEKDGEDVSLRISADSNYAVYVNGVIAAFGQYGDFPYCKVADTHDLSAYCKKGENEILITVWYYGVPSICYYPGEAGLFFEITAGDEVVAASGTDTPCRLNPYYVQHYGKILTSQIGLSFYYNAAGAVTEYHPAVATGYAPELHERPILPLVLDELRPGVVVGGNGVRHFLLDIGREDCGFLELALVSETEQKITVAYGEHNLDGCVRAKIAGRDFTVEYGTCIGENLYMNPFRRLGCRFIEIFAEAPIKLRYAGIRPTSYPVTEIPFDAGTPLRRQIYEVSKRTLRLCMHEHYEDCPWREQGLYAGDGRNEMLAAYYGFGETRFTRACLWLFAQDRREDGFLSMCAPSGPMRPIPSFGLHWYQGIREYVDNSGDETLASEIWEKMCSALKAYMPYFDAERSLFRCPPDEEYWNFYEWTGTHMTGGAGVKDMPGRVDLLLNCLFLRAADNMKYLAEKFDLTFDLAYICDPLRAAIRKTFRREDGLYNTYETMEHICEFGCALAVLTGVADEADAAVICRMLSDTETEIPVVKVNLNSSTRRYMSDVLPDTTGIVPVISIMLSMTSLVYDALLKTDREKYREFVLSDIDRRYGYMLDHGATTFWETMEGCSDDPAGSLCHGWAAMPIYYYRTLL